ncbi:MAG TPA: dTDP-glucose 4,6-dehydratase [Planctomycetota bacterium]|nr:dTDP-glucose 4,6-dehydratase [Planctomycetota bacterium]
MQTPAKTKSLIVTGGCGFIGSHFIRHMLAHTKVEKIVNLDLLTYAANAQNLADVRHDPRYTFVHGDICDFDLAIHLMTGADAIVNFAAESHVDRSIHDCAEFVRTNITGVQNLLDAARKTSLKRFVQISTDEVYGSLGPQGSFTEQTPLAPNSPYSASKASADLLIRAYCQTYGLPAIITRGANNYGPCQHPEKLIPLFINNLLAGRKATLYGDGLNVRDWIFVQDHCSAIANVLEKGRPGQIYNIGANCELTNLQIAQRLITLLGNDPSHIEFVDDRPGHDRRYAIDSSKITTELGWRPQYTFDTAFRQTVDWYRQHRDWLERS